MGETVYSEHNPDSGLLDSFYWRFTKNHHSVYQGDPVKGNGLLVSHEYKRDGSLTYPRDDRTIELGKSKVIFGDFSDFGWKGDIGFEFLDIQDTGSCDLILFGKCLSGMEFQFHNMHQKYGFYRGSRYFDETVARDSAMGDHPRLKRPDIQECGYWMEGPRLVVDTGRVVDQLFRRVDVFHGTIRNRTRQSHDGLKPNDLEREVQVLAADILGSGIIGEYCENTK